MNICYNQIGNQMNCKLTKVLKFIIDYWLTKDAEFYNGFIKNLLDKGKTEAYCKENEDKLFLQRDSSELWKIVFPNKWQVVIKMCTLRK